MALQSCATDKPDSAKQILFLPVNMWGHTKALCILAARIARLRPATTLTVFVGSRFLERACAEVRDDLILEGERLLSHVRFVPLEQGDHPIDSSVYEAAFLDTWAKLLSGSSLTCYPADESDSTKHHLRLRDAFIDAAVIDIFMVKAFRAMHAYRQTVPSWDQSLKFKIYNWLPAATNCMAAWFGEDRVPLAQDISARTGVSFEAAAYEIFLTPKGNVLHSPCLPPMYDHEIHPQALPFPPEFAGSVLINVNGAIRDSDGVITLDAVEYHPEATRALRGWLSDMGRQAFYAGPLVSGGGATEPGRAGPEKGVGEVPAFLEAQLASRGQHSVVMISFGSMFWPADPAKLGTVLNVLMDEEIPFIMSCSSPFAAIPDDTRARLSSYESAYISDWLPQQYIMDHPATGWCLTHAGHNTVLECIVAQVPMILWPIDADQSANAVYLTDNLRIGYELLEVRNGTGLGPIYRTGRTPSGTLEAVRDELRGVLARVSGEEGEAMRERVRALGGKLRRAWAEDSDEGVARKDVEAFLNHL
ncbi:UDP-Glycosyltransferase/glycogen phosphorylase [Trametes meyenii]|nr:UDP-Glycosyltransferase/glycogen phosphorylase [Trametes meyenii]